MDTAATTNAFLAWFAEWGQVAYILTQMLFWVVIAAAASIVALQYKRLVSFKVGAPAKVGNVDGPHAARAVEPFVE